MKTRFWITLTMVLMLTLPLTVLAQPPGGGPGFFGPDGPGRGHGPGPGARGERGLRGIFPPPGYLDLTDEQIAAVEALIEGLRAELEPLREQSMNLHSELRTALESESPNAQTVGQLVIDSHALREQKKTIIESYVAQFEALLTAEQREKWENFRELRESRRHGRHDDEEPTP